MLPVSQLTALHSPVLMCAASGICGYVYVSRALPSALMERRLEYRLIGAGEVLDQVTFTVLAVALVLGGLGLPGVMLALALQGAADAAALAPPHASDAVPGPARDGAPGDPRLRASRARAWRSAC